MSQIPYVTREAWLNEAAVHLNAMIAANTDLKPAKKVLVSAGWPRRDRGGAVIGQCYTKATGGGHSHIFVTPMLGRAVDVLSVLLHELIHAADDCQNSHTGPFRKAWADLGFIDKPTTSVPGKDLKAALTEIARELGKYPHRALTPVETGEKKQTTRMLKLTCVNCEYVVRTTQKWLDEGLPTCHCGGAFEQEEKR